MLRNVTVPMQLRISLIWPYCLACLFISPTKPASAIQNQDAQQLEMGKPIERELAGGQSHAYQITLAAEQYLHVVVEQRGIDVVVVVYGPDGKKLNEIDSPTGTQGPEPVSLIIETAGDYRVEVRSREKNAPAGRYEVKIAELRTPTPRDRSRVAAEKLAAEGKALLDQRTAGHKREAIKKYEESLPLWRALGEPSKEAEALFSIGAIHRNLGEAQKALEYYNQALPLWQAAGDHRNEAYTLNDIGLNYKNLGEMQKALDYYGQALSIHEVINNYHGQLQTLNNIGGAYDSLGEKKKALDFYNRALPLSRTTSYRQVEAILLTGIGKIYVNLGETQKGLNHYSQALLLFQAVDDRMGEGVILNNIGNTYSLLGEKHKALDYLNRSLTIRQAIGDQMGEGYTLDSIGVIHRDLGDSQKALDFLNRALTLRQSIGDQFGQADTLISIGNVYLVLSEYQKALAYYNRALTLSQAIGHRSEEASALHNIGLTYSSLGEHQKGLNYYSQALLLMRDVNSQREEAATLYRIARAHRDLNNLAQARSQAESALNIVESLRTKITSQELRTSYFATVQDIYQFYVELQMQLHIQHPLEGHNAIALQTSERARARSLLELLVEARVDIHQGVDPELVAKERNLQQRLNAKGEILTRLKSSKRMKEQTALLEKEINALTTDFQQVRAEIKQKSPHYAALTQPEPLSLSEIQRQVLDSDSILLEYTLGEGRSFLWLVTTTSVNAFELPKRAVIEEAAQKVYEILTARTRCVKGQDQQPMPLAQAVQIEAQYQQAAAALSQMVLGPVANQLGNKRLLIVSEGGLQSIPFGVLPMPNVAGQVPLIAEHEIVNLPSASTLGVLRRELAGRTAAPKTVAVIADPVFDADSLAEYRLAKKVKKAGTSTAPVLVATATGRALRDFGVACAGMGLPPLPFSKQEARAIEALTRAPQRQVWLGLEANRESFLKADLTLYRIVHFATHGRINSEHPDLSGLVLSRVDENGKEQNGILQLHEIYNLKLNADLVVLSACETAQGKEIRGEGRIGMARGFMYAGAARVLASLWKVDDEATSDFMKLFYAKLLREKLRPAAALRAAQNEMRKQTRWQSPYFWSGFVLQGEYQ